MRSKRLQREIDDLVAQGWRIEDEDRDRVVMVNREFGSLASHVVVALLTFWWTMGLGNVVWGAYNYVSNSRRRVLWEDTAGCPDCGAAVSADATYCPDCGASLEDRPRDGPTADGGVLCPACEAVVSEGSQYCRVCGVKLSDVSTPERSENE
ncbi:zinc ribbon domain-containing protein [Natronorubrum aibiense]|uniref:Zinc-ribbon domain-containing protein n=1 Tax=Natronorubrum aibiense TaxID=348826 RepID=A0A5P9P6M9_9EURY|nr:zinc ribbon domain-containing protein [Natronorubrum aibiense]QFU83450.1 zinc-ribbon domain-containing protein [Natronorubrum aibiense]